VRLATVAEDGRSAVGLVRGGRVLVLPAVDERFRSLRSIAAGGPEALERVHRWADRQPDEAYRAIADVELGPAVPDPGAIYTIGLNYRDAGEPAGERPERPFVYGKVASSTGSHGATVAWDRSLTSNVDPEAELGVVIGEPAVAVSAGAALDHVFGYTCINDISSRDAWLDGDQWLLGKSFAGFCPVGPWVVTRDEVDPSDLGIGCILNGIPIQDGRTGHMRFSIAEIVSYLSRHVALRPGDLIASGTPARLPSPLGPDRHLEAGDVVTVWIERIGELTTSIA
jgi:2-keto-4-pentenoate hydratase/2-oxohepta-3-ene-1,7-dioic acid hydratase in catechol pathway